MKFAFLIEPPFNDVAEDGAVIGCDVALARAVLERVGVDAVEMVQTEFADLMPGLSDGRWRMTCGLFATEGRRRLATFSRPIWALPDGLLTRDDDAGALISYGAVIGRPGAMLAVVRDQQQPETAMSLGLSPERLLVFESYDAAADAVRTGRAAAYASVARAHHGYLAARPEASGLSVQTIPADEKPPAFGRFAFARDDAAFRDHIDTALTAYLGAPAHRAMMRRYGFTDAEIDAIAP